MKNSFEAVIALVNSGFSETTMDAAREAGAHGGTIIHARGTGTKEIEKKFNIAVSPDKEMILIVVSVDIRDAVLSAINKAVGLKTNGRGIAFSIPIGNVSGLKFDSDEIENKKN